MLRKTLFIKPKLQVKYIFMSVLLTMTSTGLVYITLSRILFTSEHFLALPPEQADAFQKTFQFSFLWVLLLLIMAFGLESLFRFHRLVGPIYVLEKAVKAIASGDLTHEFKLRKNDELKDVAEEFTALRNGLKNFVVNDQNICKNIDRKLQNISDLISKESSSASIQKEIESVRKELAAISSHYKISA